MLNRVQKIGILIMNIDQPRVPAGNANGGQWTSSPSGIVAAQMLQKINSSGDSVEFGIRVIASDHEIYGSVAEGAVLKESFKWKDGDSTNKKLPGTSVVEIKSKTIEGIKDAMHKAGVLGTNGPNGYYFGDKVALVRGQKIKVGQDVGEAIFKNASVIGIWKKPKQGLAEVSPN